MVATNDCTLTLLLKQASEEMANLYCKSQGVLYIYCKV